jgi:hypothetical protein
MYAVRMLCVCFVYAVCMLYVWINAKHAKLTPTLQGIAAIAFHSVLGLHMTSLSLPGKCSPRAKLPLNWTNAPKGAVDTGIK